jgi:xanthine dehydrogenase accessory factor
MSAEQSQIKVSDLTEAIREVLQRGSTAALVTLLDSSELRPGAKLLITETRERVGSLGDPALDDAVTDYSSTFFKTRDEAKLFRVAQFAPALAKFSNASVLFERIEAEPRLIVAGAGHVGASLARLAALVGYRVTLIDDRAEFVAGERFGSANEQSIELIAAKNWSEALGEAIQNGRGVSIAIATRGHKQDEECLRSALNSNAVYVGMIGSKRRTNIVLEKLREEGFAEDRLKSVRAPIGLDLGAVSPEEVALSILAEIVTERRGGTGGPLSAWRRE